nr:hypothetical protein [Mucilaginibacter sp. FT3.2]MBB6231903.1 hypothetical protein [Mucilaginibacter sp. FT3.2]
MDASTKLVYDNIYSNAVMFLRRAIKELIAHSGDHLEREQAVVACIFIQMSIELGFKAYLIKTCSLSSILLKKHKDQPIQELMEAFEQGKLKTKSFEDLKNIIIADEGLFDEERIQYINDFQDYRNQAVHFHLNLAPGDLFDLRYDLVYMLVHVVIPILTEINMDFETPSEFYENQLDKNDFKTLIKFRPYVEEMKKVAAEHSRLVYNCIECEERTYNVDNEMCYCCNLQFTDFGEYVTCISCKAPRSVIFDHNNIAINDNIMNGLCLNCGERPEVFKCPHCGVARAFYDKRELKMVCCEMAEA